MKERTQKEAQRRERESIAFHLKLDIEKESENESKSQGLNAELDASIVVQWSRKTCGDRWTQTDSTRRFGSDCAKSSESHSR
jgi:hypothetical protein